MSGQKILWLPCHREDQEHAVELNRLYHQDIVRSNPCVLARSLGASSVSLTLPSAPDISLKPSKITAITPYQRWIQPFVTKKGSKTKFSLKHNVMNV